MTFYQIHVLVAGEVKLFYEYEFTSSCDLMKKVTEAWKDADGVADDIRFVPEGSPEWRTFQMLRMQDFKCAEHGIFEKMLDIKSSDSDARFDAVRSHACPKCGEAAPGVWTKAPGFRMADNVHTVAFGGRIHDREEVERQLDQREEKKNFWESEDFGQDFKTRLGNNIRKYVNGDLPTNEDVSPAAAAEVEKLEKTVDHEAMRASQEQITEVVRKTEFPD